MWIFTKNGFVSCVQHRDKPDTIIVRSRSFEHLAAFVGEGLATDIFTLENSDYQFRIALTRSTLQKLVAAQVEQLNYPNFKDSISYSDHRYIRACSSTWEVLYHAFRG